MQKILPVVIVLIAVIVSVSKASLTSKIVKENKDHPGKCYDTSTKKAYVVDSTWTDEGCTRSSCSIGTEKGTYEIFRAGCVPVEDQEGCKIISDSQMPFPECCPKVICDGVYSGSSRRKIVLGCAQSLLAIVAEWSQAGRIAWYHTEGNRACASGYVGAKRDG
uniref:Single domain-containing protein n=1 Tax=Timema poppense TaxID=170557 RepID=A0A7R9D7W9_TIMPO|nr:unnamed protein product [Timema poppensis]